MNILFPTTCILEEDLKNGVQKRVNNSKPEDAIFIRVCLQVFGPRLASGNLAFGMFSLLPNG